VLVTGHRGFKGGWLALYLRALGADVHGFGRSRTAGPSFYRIARVRGSLASDTAGDVVDLVALRETIARVQPHVVFHLAARAIVGESVEDPVGTIEANVLGTANVLEAVRLSGASVLATVVVTSDKVYGNDERTTPYVEDDRLGGRDPYGASKAAAEIIAASYRATYGLNVVTARSGNVIGGGDWGPRRLIPNLLRAHDHGTAFTAHPGERPFLHVLDSVAGYAKLAHWAKWSRPASGPAAFNFGPAQSACVTALAHLAAAWLPEKVEIEHAGELRGEDAQRLAISTDLARDVLGWSPRWKLTDAVEHTMAWHREHRHGADMQLVTMEQIHEHQEAA
jgi:CDP-glucose 4,6-dehydratase